MSRHAVLTGGGTGIGLATARRLVAEGVTVSIVGRRAEVLEQAAVDLGTGVNALTADLTDPADVSRLARALPDKIDVLVHNAGGNSPRTRSTDPVDVSDPDHLAALAADWEADYRLNVVSAVMLTEALLPRLSRPGGRIVALSSISALRGGGPYGAAKGAINVWVTELAAALAPDGITVNAVAPGFIPDTGFWQGRATPEVTENRVGRTPIGRPGTPDEVAALITHLTSPDAGFTTGQVVGIHGGMLLARL